MIQEKLSEVRINKGLNKTQMAKLIAMGQTTYSRKENGKSSITKEEWQRFAKALEVNVEDIKKEKPQSVKNENCTFSENSVGGIQNINIPQYILDVIIKYNAKLEEENEKLQKKNKELEQEIQNLKTQ